MFSLKVVTPNSTFYEDQVDMAIFKTTLGDRAILNGHIPILAGIKEGKLRIKKDGGPFKTADIGNGFVTVNSDTETVILTESAAWRENEV